MKFSGKMWLMIILKVPKNHAFTLSLEDTFLKNPQGCQIDPDNLLRVNSLILSYPIFTQVL